MSFLKTHKSFLLPFFSFLIIFIVSNQAHASGENLVHSISKGSPLITSDSIKVNTITRGFAANQPIYKVMTQTVGKGLFLAVFRKGVALSPWGLGLMVAYDYFLDDGVISKLQIDPSNPTLKCRVGNWTTDAFSLDECGRLYVETFSSRTQRNFTFLHTTVKINGESVYVHFSYEQLIPYVGWDPELKYNQAVMTYTYINQDSEELIVPVSDDELFNSINDHTRTNSDLNNNDMFLNPDGSVNQDYFPNPEFEYITQADSELMDLYEAGLLQSADPLLDNFISPAELARIKALWEEANKTPEQQAAELTSDIDQPITQQQYAEEQTKKENRASAKQQVELDELNSVDDSVLDKTTELDEQFNLLDGMMNNLNPIPAIPAVPIFTYSSSCRQMTIEANIPFFGIVGSVAFPSDFQCQKILNPFKDMMGWLVFMSVTFLIIIELLKEIH